MNPLDQYVQSQVGPMLQPGEQVLHFAQVRRQPGLFWQIVLIGGLLLALMTKHYFAVLTNRRLILILTKGGFWTGAAKPMNLGIEEYDVRSFKSVKASGFANNRSITFESEGKKMTLRISPWQKAVSGTAAFLEAVPHIINSGQLAHGQLPAAAPPQQAQYGAPPQQYGAPPLAQQYGAPPAQQYGAPPAAQYGGPPPQQYGAPPAQQYGAPPAQQYGAPPQHQQYGAPLALVPGARVMVLAQDGQHYPGTVVQVQGDHCLCAMQNGQFWFPSHAVSPA